LYASSGPDGNVAAITPGVFHDSGPGGDAVGIDWRYEGMSSGTLYMNSKCEGGNCNARGNGQIFPYLLAARDMVSDWHPAGKAPQINLRPFTLTPNQKEGITMFAPSPLPYNERWRFGFHNGKVPDVWAEIKYVCLFSIPMFSGRAEGEK